MKIFLLTLSLLLGAPSDDNELTGRVIAVHNGDTLTVEIERELFKARLVDIDAPEHKQPFGPAAHRFLKEIALEQTVRLEVEWIDSNKMLICRAILQDGRVLNDEMLASGLAWHYRVRPEPLERLIRLEHFAFSHSMGLWMQKNPIPPWEFRRERLLPDAPVSANSVDYDLIFQYGMVGDRQSKKYQWPDCKHYRSWHPRQPVTFTNMVEAENLGYLPSKGCP